MGVVRRWVINEIGVQIIVSLATSTFLKHNGYGARIINRQLYVSTSDRNTSRGCKILEFLGIRNFLNLILASSFKKMIVTEHKLPNPPTPKLTTTECEAGHISY